VRTSSALGDSRSRIAKFIKAAVRFPRFRFALVSVGFGFGSHDSVHDLRGSRATPSRHHFLVPAHVGVVAEVAPPKPKPITSRRHFGGWLLISIWFWRNWANHEVTTSLEPQLIHQATISIWPILACCSQSLLQFLILKANFRRCQAPLVLALIFGGSKLAGKLRS
jgi:hypothetical protein